MVLRESFIFSDQANCWRSPAVDTQNRMGYLLVTSLSFLPCTGGYIIIFFVLVLVIGVVYTPDLCYLSFVSNFFLVVTKSRKYWLANHTGIIIVQNIVFWAWCSFIRF